mmetsp:Transcript_17018/g.35974  ORF Transcript_17018/g.35974 Transcript_17018/m.35974 type:complete len:364 (-) Transcript_17018:144-1235(-)
MAGPFPNTTPSQRGLVVWDPLGRAVVPRSKPGGVPADARLRDGRHDEDRILRAGLARAPPARRNQRPAVPGLAGPALLLCRRAHPRLLRRLPPERARAQEVGGAARGGVHRHLGRHLLHRRPVHLPGAAEHAAAAGDARAALGRHLRRRGAAQDRGAQLHRVDTRLLQHLPPLPQHPGRAYALRGPGVLPRLVELDHGGLLLAHVEPSCAHVDGGPRLPAPHAPQMVQAVGVARHLPAVCCAARTHCQHPLPQLQAPRLRRHDGPGAADPGHGAVQEHADGQRHLLALHHARTAHDRAALRAGPRQGPLRPLERGRHRLLDCAPFCSQDEHYGSVLISAPAVCVSFRSKWILAHASTFNSLWP